MASELPFACRCGTVAGTIAGVSPRNGDRVVCHCTDCQRFATGFDAAERVMDGCGGTDLYQSRCAAVSIASGRDAMRCVHLTEQATLRWYASCCDTPMFNTYANGKVPYITTLLGNCDRAQVDGALGPPLGHLFLKEATRDPGAVPEMRMARLMRRFFARTIRDIVSGDRRRAALFNSKTFAPIATPTRRNATDA